MVHYGAPTPKPLYAFCNSHHVSKIYQGRLQNWSKKKEVLKQQGKAQDLVIKYKDSNGRQRWKGSPQLRSSECGS